MNKLVSSYPSPKSSSSSSSPPAGLGGLPFSFDKELTSIDNIHPRIVQDMKAFENFDMTSYNLQTEGGEFLFDFPPVPSAASFPQAMPDIQYQDASIYGNDLFIQPPVSGYQQIGQAPATNGFSPGPPVLDTTWQSFVEQLGF